MTMYEYLKELGIEFQKEKHISRKGKGRSYFLDAYLPNQNLCIEYDGHSLHKGSERDIARDKFLLENKKIKTLRIARKDIFNKIYSLNLIKEFVKQNEMD